MIRIINDTHLGATRREGTTPVTQAALRSFLIDNLRALLVGTADVVVNGDLFDGFSVDPAVVVDAHGVFSDYLSAGHKHLTLISGNHDWSPRGDKLSSFHMLAYFLQDQFGDQVTVIDHTHGFSFLTNDHGIPIYSIPHMPNQELFNLEVQKAIATPAEAGVEKRVLLVHCNVMCGYAVNSDHSLNLDEDQVTDLIQAGWQVIAGHEHQYSTRRAGKVLVPGNQVPSSVSDCLGNDTKQYVEIHDGEIKLVHHLKIDDVYAEVDWEAEDIPGLPFIRVAGQAESHRAADVVNRISNLRQHSDAWVITNAVKVEGAADFDALTEVTFEDIGKVDVLGLLLEEMTEREAAAIKGLLT